MTREPNLLGLNEEVIAGLKDFYESTMADTNIVAGIDGRLAGFNAAVRSLSPRKVVREDSFVFDGSHIVINGNEYSLGAPCPEMAGKTVTFEVCEPDNYLLSMGLEQILGFISKWKLTDGHIKFLADKNLSHETVLNLSKHRTLDLTVEAIPEGIPVFANEPFLSVEGTFERAQFPETLALGTWGFESAIATEASYYLNILKECGRADILAVEGGSRRLYPAAAPAATRAALGAGFNFTSLEQIAQFYPYLLGRVGGSSGHSAILHIGSDEEAFELQMKAYYRIKESDSAAIVREKIRSTKGAGPTFLIDTFDTEKGLEAAIRVMKRYGIQCQVRNDSGDQLKETKHIRMRFGEEELGNAKIMISDDLKPWRVYDLLKRGADFNVLLAGTYLVNPKPRGPVFKLAMDQRDPKHPTMDYVSKVSRANPAKGTLPGFLDVYRIIGKDNYADRDVILLRNVDSIAEYVKPGEDVIQLNQRVMDRGELCYDIPDMCEIMENTRKHLALLRPEHKLFVGAQPYQVIISETVKKIQREFARKFDTGRL